MNNSHSGEFRLSPEVIDGINHIERERREINPEDNNYKNHLILFSVIFFIVIFIFAGLKALTGSNLFDMLLTPWIGFGPFYLVYLVSKQKKQNKNMQNYHSVYLQDVMLPLLKHLNPQFTYDRNGSIFDHNKAIFKERFSTTSVRKSEDLVEGTIDGINVRFGEVEVLADQEYVKFLCFVADFNKNLTSTTMLNPKLLSYSLSYAFSAKFKGLKRIRLDNPSFNKKYMTMSNNEVESRYILTPDFMEKILKTKQYLSGYYLFQNNKILFLGSIGADLFDIDADSDIYEQTLQTAKALKQLLGLVEAFNLNSRIWK